jgi:hypothetical protein
MGTLSKENLVNDKTLQLRRLPRRPETGLLAWQATVGYISQEYSADATLTFAALPHADSILWQSTLSWDQNRVSIGNQPSLPASLNNLWEAVNSEYTIFKKNEDRIRQPAFYQDHQWLDAETSKTLDRLTQITHAAFTQDWTLIIVYQSVENPALRVKTRLIARGNSIQVGGQGASVAEACRDLYRHAAPNYFANSSKLGDGILS